jgi:protein gp37
MPIVCIEPILGPVVIDDFLKRLDWVVVGREAGPKSRPVQPEWGQNLRDRCTAFGSPLFLSDIGEWVLPNPKTMPEPAED